MNKIWQNVKHLPSTIAGLCAVIIGAMQLPAVQAVLRLSPVWAKDAGEIALWAGGISAVLVLGQQRFGTSKAPTPKS